MNHRKLLALLLIGVIAMPGLLHAQLNFNGSRGLVYVQSAWTLERGFFTLSGHARAFAAKPSGSTVTFYDATGRFNLNYGIKEHIELFATPSVYQDTHQGDGVNMPDDFFLGAKFGSFGAPASSFSFGATVSARLPSGESHNVPFEPYAANRFAFGFTGLLSYSKDPLYPEDATSVHVNLGYWNHNDDGAELFRGAPEETEPQSTSQELLYGLGVRVPMETFDFSVELYGNAFLTSPPPAAYSRESYLYITPAIYYKPLRWLSFNLGIDLRVADGSDETLYSPAPGGVNPTYLDQPNYPSWRLNLGSNVTLLPKSVFQSSDRDVLMKKAKTRRDLFEQIIKEQKETESAEAELERIKAERIRAEQELDRLRRILEGQEGGVDDESRETDGKNESKPEN